MVHFWRVFENLKLAVKKCYQTGQDKKWWRRPKFKNSNATFWVIFKQCDYDTSCKVLIIYSNAKKVLHKEMKNADCIFLSFWLVHNEFCFSVFPYENEKLQFFLKTKIIFRDIEKTTKVFIVLTFFKKGRPSTQFW